MNPQPPNDSQPDVRNAPIEWKQVLEFVQQQAELDRNNFDRQVKRAYSFIGVAAIVVLFGIGSTLFDIQKNARERTEEVIKQMQIFVRTRVAQEFEEENIRKLVRAAAEKVSSEQLNAILRDEVTRQVKAQVSQQTAFIQSSVREQAKSQVQNVLRPRVLSLADKKTMVDLLKKTGSTARFSVWAIGGNGSEPVSLAKQLVEVLVESGYSQKGEISQAMTPGIEYTGIGMFVRDEKDKSKAAPVVEALSRVHIDARVEIEDKTKPYTIRLDPETDIRIVFGPRF